MFKLLLGMSYFFMIYGNKLVAFFLYGVLHADDDEELLNLVCEILPLQSGAQLKRGRPAEGAPNPPNFSLSSVIFFFFLKNFFCFFVFVPPPPPPLLHYQASLLFAITNFVYYQRICLVYD
ncbi:hypothetical protein Hanom_Chr03g00214711 [Helianthus anomalus]